MKIFVGMVFLFGFQICFTAIPPPMEREDLFEGDLFIPEFIDAAKNEMDILSTLAARKTGGRWPGGVMPYVISPRMGQSGLTVIRSAMNEWQEKTCLRFIRRTTQKNYVEFITGGGGILFWLTPDDFIHLLGKPSDRNELLINCWSNAIGSKGDEKQQINLDPGCWRHGIVVHEIGHAFGFWHEQSRPDRDDFVEIVWDNIKSGLQSQFRKYSRSTIDSLGIRYDYASIMHYGKTAFTKNGGDTIVPIQTGVKIGQRLGLSELDVEQANKMYMCFSTIQPPTQEPKRQVMEGYILHLQSNTCFSPLGNRVLGENHPVVASLSCDGKSNLFKLHGNGSIEHVNSGMCLHPTGDCILPEDNTELVLSRTCDNPKQQFAIFDDGLFKHLYSETCVRPVIGVKNVSDQTRIVVHSECDVDKFAFGFSVSAPNAKNLALGKSTSQSSTIYDAVSSKAVDGDRNGGYHKGSCTHTKLSQHPWWRVDLGKQVNIDSVLVTNRADCCWERISNFEVRVGDSWRIDSNPRCGGRHSLKRGETKSISCNALKGRFVSISLQNSRGVYLTLCEVEVYGALNGPTPPSRPTPDIQGVLQHSQSKLCVFPKYKDIANNSAVVLTASCTERFARFRSLNDGSLQHISTNMCLSPKNGCSEASKDTELVLIDQCRRDVTSFKFTDEGALMHVKSKTCARPSSYPISNKDTTMVVLNSVCDATKHKFELLTVPVPPATILPITGNCGHVMIRSSMVIGGENARPGAWPWQIALQRYGRFICGGSLIKRDLVLTAAHCISTSVSPENYMVVLGDHDRSKNENSEVSIKVKKYYKHARYSKPYPINNDIALLQLDHPVKLTSRINTICLPSQDYKLPITSTCYITGWGKIHHPGSSHPILQEAKLPPVTNAVCQEKLKKSPGSSTLTITENMLCAGQEGTKLSGCHGDSGGPYVCKENGRWFLQGIVSWGSSTCSAADRYTVFARTAKFIPWINDQIDSIQT